MFNKYNLLQEVDELNQTISEYASPLAEAKKQYIIADKKNTELQKNQKEELKIKYAKIYKRLQEENKTQSDTKLKQLVYAEEEYESFLIEQKQEAEISIENLGEKIKEQEEALSNYYIATGKRRQITDGVALLLGGFFEVNTKKIEEEVQSIKTTRSKLKKLKTRRKD